MHVWHCSRADLADPAQARFVACLNRDEQKRAGRFVFETDRRRFAFGRALMRTLLARYLEQPPSTLAFAYEANGKPTLADHPELHFNLSHAGDVFALAVTRAAPVGIDVEAIVEPLDRASLARHALTPSEQAALGDLAPEHRLQALFDYWVCKEAALKATGRGINAAQDVEIADLLTSAGPFRVRDRSGVVTGHGTRVRVARDHAAAVASSVPIAVTSIRLDPSAGSFEVLSP